MGLPTPSQSKRLDLPLGPELKVCISFSVRRVDLFMYYPDQCKLVFRNSFRMQYFVRISAKKLETGKTITLPSIFIFLLR